MKKQFGEFNVDEHLEFAVDMDRGIFAHARVAAINEHILTLELDQEDGSQRRVLGMADRFAFSFWIRYAIYFTLKICFL
jgi:hypothetical protein